MIKIDNVYKSFGKKKILNGISLEAYPGEKIAIIGRNGCGKSTLLQILAGVIPADSGTVEYFGKKRGNCGYIPQENPLLEDCSVMDNLKLYGITREQIQHPFYQKLQLEELLKMKVSKLSGGMKRRVSIACGTSQMPPIVLMDEPTTALDLYYKAMIHEWMDDYSRQNGILLITSHDEQEIHSCDRCYLLRDGQLIEGGLEMLTMKE